MLVCSWRKMVGTREWSRVPEEEKAYTRQATEALILSEPSDQVSCRRTEVSCTIARLCDSNNGMLRTPYISQSQYVLIALPAARTTACASSDVCTRRTHNLMPMRSLRDKSPSVITRSVDCCALWHTGLSRANFHRESGPHESCRWRHSWRY